MFLHDTPTPPHSQNYPPQKLRPAKSEDGEIYASRNANK